MSVELQRDGAVAVMRLNRPQQLNALTPAMRLEMERIVIEVRDDPAIRALLITGAGRGFCSGGDIATFGKTDVVSMREFTNSRVYPSAGARATSAAPRLPVAPGLRSLFSPVDQGTGLPGFGERRAGTLSGGEQPMVTIGRALPDGA